MVRPGKGKRARRRRGREGLPGQSLSVFTGEDEDEEEEEDDDDDVDDETAKSNSPVLSDWRGTFPAVKPRGDPPGVQSIWTELELTPDADGKTDDDWAATIQHIELRYRDAEGISTLIKTFKLEQKSVLMCAIQSLARLGRIDLSLAVFDLHQQELSHQHDLVLGLSLGCYRNGLTTEGDKLRRQLLDGLEDLAVSTEFDAELLVAALDARLSPFLARKKGGRRIVWDDAADLAIAGVLGEARVRPLPVPAYNTMIRLLGKAGRLSDVFQVLDGMKDARIDADAETLEFVAGAVVKDVQFAGRSTNMRNLPQTVPSLPEVVFVGRSNVGKSSLVNMMVNRKALAPTSSKPGFTQHFNYYKVNDARKDAPEFFLVDVPGLGFASTVRDGTRDSWRSTLERYLEVREPLRAVFHLVDCNTGPAEADRDLMRMVKRWNKGRSTYIVVLTKLDKVTMQKVARSTEAVRTACIEEGWGADELPLIVSCSSKTRLGRDVLWSCLRDALNLSEVEKR
jgi:ribosome biogenesis GTP-binding protein YsxC/EngB